MLSIATYKICLKYRVIDQRYKQDKFIKVDYDNSYYSDFYIKGNRVYITCILSVYNDSEKKQKFYIRAKYTEEEGRLLANNKYLKIKENKQEKVIELNPKEKQTINVIFEGDFGEKKQKLNRLLPNEIKIVHITEKRK